MAFKTVMTKGTKNHPATASENEADVTHNKSVTIRVTKKTITGEKEFVRSFEVGDEAEYDSFNLKYTGEILSITPNTVSIRSMYGKTTRLSLHEFCWRNYDFDAAKVSAENHETMMYI